MNPDKPEQGARPVLRWWGWLLSVAVIVGVIGSMAFPKTASVPSATVPFTVTTAPPQGVDPSVIEISVDMLLNAYNNSVPKANNMYMGQKLRVSGLLSNIGENGGQKYVELRPLGNVLSPTDTVRFYFISDDVFMLAASAPAGSEVQITGTCQSYPPLVFSDCSLVHLPQE